MIRTDQDFVNEEEPLLPNASNANARVVNGRIDVSIWSNLVFQWLSPILDVGFKKKRLDPDDLNLAPLPIDCSSQHAYDRFQQFWKVEIMISPTKPSILKVLFQAFGREFIYAGILKLTHDVCRFVGPQVLRQMILYLQEEETGERTIQRILFLTGSLILAQIIMSLCLSHYYYKCDCVGLRVRNALVVSIYRKNFLLSARERQNRSTGEVTNLISIDAERLLGTYGKFYKVNCPEIVKPNLRPIWILVLKEWMPYVNYIWSCPFQIFIALLFLWKELGPSALGALAVILIMIPISKMLSKWMGMIQEELMTAIDERVDANSEILSNMKILKLQAWEEFFQKRLLDLREIELKQIYRYFVADAVSEGTAAKKQ
jgi:ABC-type multidrug transport system fused ATPase/permease subunit